MRILFLSNFYPPYEIGGYEQWCAEVGSRLEARGHEIEILTSNYGIPAGFKEDDRRISRVLYLQSDISYYQPLNFFLKHACQERRNIGNLQRKIEEFQPDVIMVWGMWNLSKCLPYWAEQLMPRKVAYYISNYWPADIDPHTSYWNLPAQSGLTETIKQPLRKIALGILKLERYPPPLQLMNAVCCSQYVRDALVGTDDLPPQSGVIFGGIDTEPFLKYAKLTGQAQRNRSEILRLLYFGRLIHDKGVHTAIQALGLLKQSNQSDNIHLTILGSGHPEYEAYLRKLATDLNVSPQVEFTEKISRDDIPIWISNFDVFLFTSIWPEPMARSVMEAMAAGLLVIGTEVGGQAEMLSHSVNSLTFTPGDASALADHIISVSKNRSLLVQLAEAGQKLSLERFTLKRMVDEIEKYLNKIAQASIETQA